MIYRNIFIFRGTKIIIIVESFTKKTQKTPQQNINLAKKRRDEIDQGGIEPQGIEIN